MPTQALLSLLNSPLQPLHRLDVGKHYWLIIKAPQHLPEVGRGQGSLVDNGGCQREQPGCAEEQEDLCLASVFRAGVCSGGSKKKDMRSCVGS